MRTFPAPQVIALGAIFALRLISVADELQPETKSRWITNGPGVFEVPAGVPANPTNGIFHHYLPSSLNNFIWTNFIARTNGRDMKIWSERTHPPEHPAQPPVARWNTNSLIWGMRGMTALSPAWESEGALGQVPVTAITRRHGYTRGHGMGPKGFNTNFAGRKVWFLTTNNVLVEAEVVRDIVWLWGSGGGGDYTLLLFKKDLPPEIEPVWSITSSNLFSRYKQLPGAPAPLFLPEQTGHVSANVPGFTMNVVKGGDSGSPDFLAFENKLVFYMGRSTAGPSPEMQADLDELCRQQKLDPGKYQLKWVDLSAFPSY